MIRSFASACLFSALLATAASASVVTLPVSVTSSTPYDATFTAANLFDGKDTTEYASASVGAGTFVSMDFGSAVSMDRILMMARGNPNDLVGQSRLTLSNDPNFASGNSVFNFNPSSTNGSALIQAFTATTARYAKWEAITAIGTFQNLGGRELRFLSTPSGSAIRSASVAGGFTQYNSTYALANASNGDAGQGEASGREYASLGGGTNMFVDFDLGAVVPVTGFDFFDRLAAVDRTTAFTLIFDDTADFSSPTGTRDFTPGGTGWGYSQNFAAVNARYVRFDATAVATVNNNSGIQEMIFYSAVPEPSALLMVGLAGLLPLARRRRA